MQKKLIIGLTGTILSGKSAALEFFNALGAFTLSADGIVSALYKDKKVSAEIKNIFGAADKKTVAAAAFKDKNKKAALEKLLHPLVLEKAFKEITRCEESVAVFEVPLLFESKSEKYFDLVITVYADAQTLAARAGKRGLAKKDFLMISATQMPAEKKAAMADIVLVNNGSKTELKQKIKKLYKVLQRIQTGEL